MRYPDADLRCCVLPVLVGLPLRSNLLFLRCIFCASPHNYLIAVIFFITNVHAG